MTYLYTVVIRAESIDIVHTLLCIEGPFSGYLEQTKLFDKNRMLIRILVGFILTFDLCLRAIFMEEISIQSAFCILQGASLYQLL